jgi:hypothetical protein
LYWFDKRDDEAAVRLMRAAVSGEGAPVVLWSREGVTSGPLLHDGALYWLQLNALWRSSLDGTDPKNLAIPERHGQTLQRMAADEIGIYFAWSDGVAIGTSKYNDDSGRIEVVSRDDNHTGTSLGLATDAKNIYTLTYARNFLGFSLDRIAKSDGEMEHLLIGSGEESALAVDDVALYMTQSNSKKSADGQVLRIQKRW